MEIRIDFMQCLELDMSLHIMSFLEEPADIVRASAVSRHWHQVVVANELAKHLCLKTFPEVTNIVSIVNTSKQKIDSAEVESNKEIEWEILEGGQKVYASLLQALTKSNLSPKDCISNAISASSTDNYPDESVINTLNPRDRFVRRASYWSSTGKRNPDVPETLIYKLRNGIWLITEIDIQPFEAFFQPGSPIYSAKYVRFRMGHPKSPREFDVQQRLPFEKPADDKFVWTYTSPKFPMAQENKLQSFKLPEAVLCIGGYLLIEFLGRVQTQEMDGLFYICVSYVRVLGRPLYPAFDIDMTEPYGKPVLKFYPENLNSVLKNTSSSEIPHLRHLEEEMLWERMGLLEDLLRGIQQGPNNPFVWEEVDVDEVDGEEVENGEGYEEEDVIL